MMSVGDKDDFGTLIDEATLVIKRRLPGPLDRVWRYLIDPDLRSKWLAAGTFEPVVGGKFELLWRNDNLSDSSDVRPAGLDAEYRLVSEIIAIEPQRLLVIAWGPGDVSFELEDVGKHVVLTITHSRFANDNVKLSVASGWHTHLQILLAVLSGEQRPSFWSSWSGLQSVYHSRFQLNSGSRQ